MNIDIIYLGITVVSALIAIPIAIFKGKAFRKNNPELKPYAWGYFTGWAGVLGFIALGVLYIGVLSIVIVDSNSHPADIFFVLLLIFFSFISAISHFFIIKRNRRAWIVGIILQLNPVLWLTNGIYLKNRWVEMGAADAETSTNI